MKKALSMLLIVGCLLAIDPSASRAQGDPTSLPADLIFTVPESPDLSWVGQPHNRLVRVDAETLEVSTFYIDDVAWEIRALAWSPQGDKLAFYRGYPTPDEGKTFPRKLCILDAAGTLLQCMQDPPYMFWGYSNEAMNSYVTWSTDGQTIQFVADREIVGDNREMVLVEADVTTGQTLRTLFSAPYNSRRERRKALGWTPTLDTVLVGVSGTSDSQSPLLVDLQTGAEISVDTLVPEHQHLGSVCPQFSPNGTYFAAHVYYDLDEYNPWELDFGALDRIFQLMIFDRQGHIQASLNEPSGAYTQPIGFSGCPVWRSDEQSFYIRGGQLTGEGKAFIFEYSFLTHQIVQQQPYAYIVRSPMVLAPDNQTLAYDVEWNSYEAGVGVNVLFPDGEILWNWGSDYASGPVWVPPVSTANTSSTPAPASKITFTQDKGCFNDGSFEFCLPANNPDALAAVQAIAPGTTCVQSRGRARCDLDSEVLCLVETRGMCLARHGAMTDEGWHTVCELAALPFVRAIVPTWYE